MCENAHDWESLQLRQEAQQWCDWNSLLLMDYNGAPLVAVEAQPLMILPDNLPAMEMMTRPERPVHDRSKKRIKRLLADVRMGVPSTDEPTTSSHDRVV